MRVLSGLAHYFGLRGMLSRVIAGIAKTCVPQSLENQACWNLVLTSLDENPLRTIRAPQMNGVSVQATPNKEPEPMAHWFPSLTTAYRALNSITLKPKEAC